jgi:hypothetical protein
MSGEASHRLGADELRALADGATSACTCVLADCQAWTRVEPYRWPAATLQAVGTLRDPELAEPTFVEFHPERTRLESPSAPIALRHYPCNRAEVWRCTACANVVLRYDEAGGYYLDSRARIVDPALVVDPAP